MSENPCLDCEAVCCSFREARVGLTILEPGARYDSKILDYVERRPGDLVLADGSPMDARWFVWDPPDEEHGRREILFECAHLTGDKLCSVYGDRPEMCRSFECEVLEGEMTMDEWHESRSADGDPDWPPPGDELTEVTERVVGIIERGGRA